VPSLDSIAVLEDNAQLVTTILDYVDSNLCTKARNGNSKVYKHFNRRRLHSHSSPLIA
jgi:hypothetical protein